MPDENLIKKLGYIRYLEMCAALLVLTLMGMETTMEMVLGVAQMEPERARASA